MTFQSEGQMPKRNARGRGRGRGRGASFSADSLTFEDPYAEDMSSRMRRAYNHHVYQQFKGDWADDWVPREQKPRITKRSTAFKTSKPKPEVAKPKVIG